MTFRNSIFLQSPIIGGKRHLKKYLYRNFSAYTNFERIQVFLVPTCLRNLFISLLFYGKFAINQSDNFRKESFLCERKIVSFLNYFGPLSDGKFSSGFSELHFTCSDGHFREKDFLRNNQNLKIFSDFERKTFNLFGKKNQQQGCQTCIRLAQRNILGRIYILFGKKMNFVNLFWTFSEKISIICQKLLGGIFKTRRDMSGKHF